MVLIDRLSFLSFVCFMHTVQTTPQIIHTEDSHPETKANPAGIIQLQAYDINIINTV